MGIISHSTRPTLSIWPVGTKVPIDTGIPLLRMPSSKACVHSLYTRGSLIEPLELDAYSFGKVWIDLPMMVDPKLDSKLHVLASMDLADDSSDIKLAEGISQLGVHPDTGRRGCYVELYNSAPSCHVLATDLFVAKVKPLSDCLGHRCIPASDDYEEPYSRATGGPFTFESVNSDHASSLASLHVLDVYVLMSTIHSLVGPVTMDTVKSTSVLSQSDEVFLKRFPSGTDMSPDQLKKLQSCILAQQHRLSVWSSDDWDIGCAKSHVHSVDMKPGTKPIRLRPYKVNQVKENFIHMFLTRMVAAGVMKEGSSPWGFPLILALKPGRDPKLPQSYRLLCDFRRLNDVIECPSAPLPLIDDLLRFIGEGNSWFSTQDITQGFFACRLDVQSQQVCTVVSPTGLSYQFLRLPQGLKSSPSFFSQATNGINDATITTA